MAFETLLVDDSRLVRTAVGDILKEIPGVHVCGEVSNGKECLDFLEQYHADLVILDVEMPVMDGITTLKEIRKSKKNIRVLMLSTLTVRGALTTFRALDLGAVDFIPKPSPDSGLTFEDIKDVLKTRIAFFLESTSKVKAQKMTSIGPTPSKFANANGKYEIVVIGVSTGGPPAIQKILKTLPSNFPVPILIVQHMPPIFTKAFADRMDELCALCVSEATNNEVVKKGHIYIAPGNYHLRLGGDKNNPLILLDQSIHRNSHRPSVDCTLESVVEMYQGNCIALIMTGMGNDGLSGMIAMHDAGALTAAQDEDSSIIYGMNKRAIEAGVIKKVWALDDISTELCKIFGL